MAKRKSKGDDKPDVEMRIEKDGDGFAVLAGDEVVDLFETEEDAQAFLDEQKDDAPSPDKATVVLRKLRAPEGIGQAGGSKGHSYQVGKDGTVEVHSEDVAALINLGFKPAV